MGSFFFLLLLTLTILLSNYPIVLVSGDTDLIQNTCKNTKYYDLCISSLNSNPMSPEADTKGLAVIMVKIGISNVTSTSSLLSSQVLNTNTTNGTLMSKVLKLCADKYSYANESLGASIKDMDTELYDYAYMHVMAASDYANACHNVFKRYSGLVYPREIGVREDGFKHICSVVLGIIDLLGS